MRAGRGREEHLDGQEGRKAHLESWQPTQKGRKGSRGVLRPSWRAGRGQEGSGGPLRGLGRVRGWEALLDSREG